MKTHITISRWLCLFACVATLNACNAERESVQTYGPPPELTEEQLELFDVTCVGCHGDKDSGAPLFGDGASWDARWAKGFDALYSHTINGFEGMPALGSCAACTKQDLELFIQYLGGRSLNQAAKEN